MAERPQRKKRRRINRIRIESAPFTPNRGDEVFYAREILSICKPMIKAVYREIIALYRGIREDVTFDDDDIAATPGDDLFDALDAMRDRYQAEFDIMAPPMAESMVERQLKAARRDFPAKLKPMLGKIASGNAIIGMAAPPAAASVLPVAGIARAALSGTPLPLVNSGNTGAAGLLPDEVNPAANFAIPGTPFDISENVRLAIRASIEESVSLIRSIPGQYLDRVAGAVTRSMQAGGSTKQLAGEIRSYAEMTFRRAKNIALDQTRKTYTSINIRQFQDAGIKKFKWIHVGGSVTPRHHHIANYPQGLNGGIFSLDAPPVIDPKRGIRGFPAQLPFCRCIMTAVIDFDEDN